MKAALPIWMGTGEIGGKGIECKNVDSRKKKMAQKLLICGINVSKTNRN